ncbi:orotidine-5'-phosphate decarboxylase [Curtobacterium flaccumfaciens]|uniref:orotidine-5'-phosphate decarboxylase n=1 Tax=Curtobacterium flaccumfaciens TaxID=2035 RepID=UPI000FFF08FF|nr:orotidine-5'-phosphate decarboxylase [Curtobacterium flaccumfaciens]MCS0644589.1 orotidine-5'-phosphate decarboxylase [Curtobacterium flaccumfaciens pv. flaccumfaciens]MCS6527719.1 orotidine-5'-phosphate decarboxylase [Curtobacterium flaccumfaciens pv. flaccumfaciens]MCS6528051.1 orotidine-5'-phosphate decarboxylase [Curtobacterium flaccumfaciens pv. flaccumfaciens]NUU09304.1 orotidine-5'-phosphate decarboxylase [Curtobacterium flaccumfaciens]RXF85861.1 orotidine-5'-phosphate decarboxylase 
MATNRSGGPASFGDRLASAMGERSPLCVGIDPHAATLAAWGLARDEQGLTAFGATLVDAAAGRAAIVKPQVAFFEAAGVAGYRALDATIRRARDAGLLVVADVKRGDIGTTGDDYALAWLDRDGPFAADAMTVSPYLGYGSLRGTIDVARRNGAGVFVLAATSNPEARVLQTAVLAEGPRTGRTVAAGIVLDVADDNRSVGDQALGDVGLVLGATLHLDDFGIDADAIGAAPVLAPGFGAQGARIEDLRALYGARAEQVLVSESRGLLTDGPDGVAALVTDRADRIRTALVAAA